VLGLRRNLGCELPRVQYTFVSQRCRSPHESRRTSSLAGHAVGLVRSPRYAPSLPPPPQRCAWNYKDRDNGKAQIDIKPFRETCSSLQNVLLLTLDVPRESLMY